MNTFHEKVGIRILYLIPASSFRFPFWPSSVLSYVFLCSTQQRRFMPKVGHLLKCLVGLGFFRGFPNLWKKMINCWSIMPSRLRLPRNSGLNPGLWWLNRFMMTRSRTVQGTGFWVQTKIVGVAAEWVKWDLGPTKKTKKPQPNKARNKQNQNEFPLHPTPQMKTPQMTQWKRMHTPFTV